MITAKYNKERNYDALLSKLINKVKILTRDKDDDFLVIAIGETGTGKSMLMLHAFEEYAEDYAIIDRVGFTREEFSVSMKKVLQSPKGFRFVGNDEANISKRDALIKYNKDLLDLYYSIRGLNIFHWWNNPSLDMIDKPFIKDRLKGCFLITTKSIDKPRIYYYFDQNGLLRILDKYKNLDFKTIRKVRKKYAVYKGWFRDYKGPLRQPYLNKKNPRMHEKVDEFFAKYGAKYNLDNGKVLTAGKLKDLTYYSTTHIQRLVGQGVLVGGVDYEVGSMPRRFFEHSILKIYDHQKELGRIRINDPVVLDKIKQLRKEEKKGGVSHA